MLRRDSLPSLGHVCTHERLESRHPEFELDLQIRAARRECDASGVCCYVIVADTKKMRSRISLLQGFTAHVRAAEVEGARAMTCA